MMKYSSNWFFGISGNKPDRFQITEDDILKIKSLKSHRSNESGYYDLMLQWRLSDNSYCEW